MDSSGHAFGWVGLGNMGSNMALNLATYAERYHYPKLRVWNRTTTKAKDLAPGYHQIATSLYEVGSTCDIVHGCLANDDVALAVYRELFKIQNKGSIYVDHSTLYPTTSKMLQAEAKKNGVYFLSCPVFGPPAAAKSADLLIILSGDTEARGIVKAYLVPSLGKALVDCGEMTADGATLKLLGNNCILGTIELLSESFTLAEKANFNVDVFYNFIRKRSNYMYTPLCYRKMLIPLKNSGFRHLRGLITEKKSAMVLSVARQALHYLVV